MSHFTEALYLKRKLNQLINENNSLYNTLRMLSEAADPPDVPTPSEDPAQTMLGRNFTAPAPLARQLDPIFFEFSQYFTNYDDFYRWYMANDPVMRRTLEQAWSHMTEAQRQSFASELTNIWEELADIIESIGDPNQIQELLRWLFNTSDALNQEVDLSDLQFVTQQQHFAALTSIMQRYRDEITRTINMLSMNRFMIDIPSGNTANLDKVIKNLRASLRVVQNAHSKIILAMMQYHANLHPDMEINRMLQWGKNEQREALEKLEALKRNPNATPEQKAKADEIIKQIKLLGSMEVSGRAASIALIITGMASLFGGGALSIESIFNWLGDFFSGVGDVVVDALQGEYDFQIGPGGFEWTNPNPIP